MNEYPGEVNFFLQRFQKRPYEYLDSFHVLSDRFIGAHSIMVSAHERALLRERDVKVCHCPFSNCGKGVPETPALLEDGICVGLGTDGAAHGGLSLWNEMKIFRSVMNVKHGVAQSNPAIMSAAQIISMLYRKDRLRRSFELKMPAGRRATQIDDLGIKKDKNLPHQILHQDRHHLENNPYPAGLPRSYGECPWK